MQAYRVNTKSKKKTLLPLRIYVLLRVAEYFFVNDKSTCLETFSALIGIFLTPYYVIVSYRSSMAFALFRSSINCRNNINISVNRERVRMTFNDSRRRVERSLTLGIFEYTFIGNGARAFEMSDDTTVELA